MFSLPVEIRFTILKEYLNPIDREIWFSALGIKKHRINYSSIVKYAAKNGYLSLFIWGYHRGCDIDKKTYEAAAEGGHLEILEWLKSYWIRARGRIPPPWDEDTCSTAASNGHLDALIWLVSNNCPWDDDVLDFAAEYGHLDILDWAEENGCSCNHLTYIAAARGGQLKVLQRLKENGCRWNPKAWEFAKDNGHLEVVTWFETNSPFRN